MNFYFQNIIRIFTCIVLSTTFLGCDAIYRLLDKEGAEEKALIGEIIPFKKNVVVEEVQILLCLYGYNTGKIDGVLGLRTRNAIENFQWDNMLEMTRFIDQVTWEKLNIFKENMLVIEGQLNARLIQVLLRKAGFNPGNIDGKMGPKTKKAVRKFQKKHSLKVDGKIGYQTLNKLAVFISDESRLEQ